AEAIQKLSLDSNNQKSIVAAALIDITQSAHRIKSYMSGRDEVSEKSDAALEFSRIADLLRQEKEQVIRSLTNVSQSSVKFAEDINSLVSAIKVQERFERTLGNSILVLGNVIREGRNMSGHDRLNGDKSEYLKNLERSYTMQSERKIHDRFAGPDKGGDENYSDQIIFPANNGSSQQEFGDNVELF
ncbi:MAG TPA: hypothetical protein VHO84_11980, partial [Syntrophorhabdaceae bacterium]|nr:hypothetical protein [Syntrophorhabdaceae bacterium]